MPHGDLNTFSPIIETTRRFRRARLDFKAACILSLNSLRELHIASSNRMAGSITVGSRVTTRTLDLLWRADFGTARLLKSAPSMKISTEGIFDSHDALTSSVTVASGSIIWASTSSEHPLIWSQMSTSSGHDSISNCNRSRSAAASVTEGRRGPAYRVDITHSSSKEIGMSRTNLEGSNLSKVTWDQITRKPIDMDDGWTEVTNDKNRKRNRRIFSLRSSEIHMSSSSSARISISSDEVNLLIYRYLIEAGMCHILECLE